MTSEQLPHPDRVEKGELYAILDASRTDPTVATDELFMNGKKNLASALDRGNPRTIEEAEGFMGAFLDAHPEYLERLQRENS